MVMAPLLVGMDGLSFEVALADQLLLLEPLRPGARCRLDKIIEDLPLHALDLQPVAGTQRRPFFGPRGLAQVFQQALEPGHALPRRRQLVIVAYHATSNMPRTVPPRDHFSSETNPMRRFGGSGGGCRSGTSLR